MSKLATELLVPAGLSPKALSVATGTTLEEVECALHGRRPVSRLLAERIPELYPHLPSRGVIGLRYSPEEWYLHNQQPTPPEILALVPVDGEPTTSAEPGINLLDWSRRHQAFTLMAARMLLENATRSQKLVIDMLVEAGFHCRRERISNDCQMTLWRWNPLHWQVRQGYGGKTAYKQPPPDAAPIKTHNFMDEYMDLYRERVLRWVEVTSAGFRRDDLYNYLIKTGDDHKTTRRQAINMLLAESEVFYNPSTKGHHKKNSV